jgi:hypothetical protein
VASEHALLSLEQALGMSIQLAMLPWCCMYGVRLVRRYCVRLRAVAQKQRRIYAASLVDKVVRDDTRQARAQ